MNVENKSFAIISDKLFFLENSVFEIVVLNFIYKHKFNHNSLKYLKVYK